MHGTWKGGVARSTRSAASEHTDGSGSARLQLDVWQFYLEPSLYGREVPTAGGARGPGRAYYVPMLSGMQLFRSMASQDEAAAAAGQGSDVFQVRAV